MLDKLKYVDKAKVANVLANVLIAYGTAKLAYNVSQLIKHIKK